VRIALACSSNCAMLGRLAILKSLLSLDDAMRTPAAQAIGRGWF